MKKRILTLFLVLTMFCSLVLAACGGDTADKGDDLTGLEKIKEEGTLVIGLDDTFVPMGFKDNSGEIVGFDVDLAKEVGKKLGVDVKFQPIDWSMKESELNGGNIDLIWNGYSITEERKEKLAFTNPYLENRQVIITLKDSPINSKSDLKDKKVGVQASSSAVDAVEKEADLLKSFKDGKLVQFETNNDALMDLEAGRIQAVVGDEILIKYYMKERGENKYKVLEEDFGNEEYGIGARKEDKDLVNAINKALDEIKKEGTAKNISEKWFGDDIIK